MPHPWPGPGIVAWSPSWLTPHMLFSELLCARSDGGKDGDAPATSLQRRSRLSVPPGSLLARRRPCRVPLWLAPLRREHQARVVLGGKCPQGMRNAPLKQRADGTWQLTPDQRLRGVSYGNGPVHERARVTIAGHRACETCVSLIWEIIEIKHRPQRLGPGFAAPDIQIPIQVKVLVAADTRYQLLFSTNGPLDLVQ